MHIKKDTYNKSTVEIASFANSLAHPARILILNTLAKRGSCICGEIVEVLPLSQSTVSQHLAELKKVGIIQGTIDGQKSCYCINWKKLKQGLDKLNEYSKNLEALSVNTCNCC